MTEGTDSQCAMEKQHSGIVLNVQCQNVWRGDGPLPVVVILEVLGKVDQPGLQGRFQVFEVVSATSFGVPLDRVHAGHDLRHDKRCGHRQELGFHIDARTRTTHQACTARESSSLRVRILEEQGHREDMVAKVPRRTGSLSVSEINGREECNPHQRLVQECRSHPCDTLLGGLAIEAHVNASTQVRFCRNLINASPSHTEDSLRKTNDKLIFTTGLELTHLSARQHDHQICLRVCFSTDTKTSLPSESFQPSASRFIPKSMAYISSARMIMRTTSLGDILCDNPFLMESIQRMRIRISKR